MPCLIELYDESIKPKVIDNILTIYDDYDSETETDAINLIKKQYKIISKDNKIVLERI